MSKLTKKLKAVYEGFDKNKAYSLEEAIALAKAKSITKFDGSMNIAIKLNLDTTKVEQQLRGSISLPHGNGKDVRILLLSEDVSAEDAKAAGANYFGGTDYIQNIEKMLNDIDVIITDPKVMPKLARLGKVLGPRGLMPNPKIGTVTTDVLKTVKEFKKGRLEYRTDTYGNIHLNIGKVSFDAEKIKENALALLTLIRSRKPSTVKGQYIQNITISPTMGAGVKVLIPNN
ncbi:50S ribosomal protein L1 [Ureaplasma miroungigenitalium]|uniref:Large ribosomal subunit protein uL1 n=1 Tax=Ureaplasma miroungigenitalium TaxID=1042321 RepID=A0ABT3BM15_9BACT|nr:50S ribosomal protein L1 [Ureaplasma miroungigenitalium]MCV3728279.1 50S ribosomal protein L1 [Ureaplasma miroungigenitalium]MCV3734084.1 50S ribosomal protein L1 [Ureaplasma miroungigenitalium]